MSERLFQTNKTERIEKDIQQFPRAPTCAYAYLHTHMHAPSTLTCIHAPKPLTCMYQTHSHACNTLTSIHYANHMHTPHTLTCMHHTLTCIHHVHSYALIIHTDMHAPNTLTCMHHTQTCIHYIHSHAFTIHTHIHASYTLHQAVKDLLCKNEALGTDPPPQNSCQNPAHPELIVSPHCGEERGGCWGWLLSLSASLVRDLNPKYGGQ